MTWLEIEAELRQLPPGASLSFARDQLPHPQDAGAARSIGVPSGQVADWRFAPTADCRGLHVHELADGWRAHLDAIHPSCDLLGHLQADAPGTLLVAGVLTGAAAGALLGRAVGPAALGATLGFLSASLLLRR